VIKTSVLLLLTLMLVAVSGRAQANSDLAGPPGTPQSAPEQGFQNRYPRYRLVAGDVMEVMFEFTPEFNRTVTVEPDGFVTLPSIGGIHVSGLTVIEVTSLLESRYSDALYEPKISVALKDFEKPYFTVGGQVAHAGRYVLHGDTTLTEAIEMAGGFTDASRHSQVLLFRHLSSEWMGARVIDVKKMMASKDLHEDIHLQSGDMVFVPQNRISKVAKFIPKSNVGAYISANPANF